MDCGLECSKEEWIVVLNAVRRSKEDCGLECSKEEWIVVLNAVRRSGLWS